MILIENVNLLKQKFPQALSSLYQFEDELDTRTIQIEKAKNGLPTFSVKIENQYFYAHSKYNPHDEADKFIRQYKELDDYRHVFFYGVGFGYHIQAFLRKFPWMTFSLYEPNPSIFYQYVSHRLLDELPIQRLKNIYIEYSEENIEPYLQHFINEVKEQVLIVVHPSYQKLFESKTSRFSELFSKHLSRKSDNLVTNYNYQKLWVLNSIVNFKRVINSPSIIRSKREIFKEKPVVLVAAGPSLEQELDNLRRIKENKLAYIFAVGSANKALVNNGIYPDAVCSYDPNTHNFKVFEEIIEQRIDTIPLIFGSSVGYNTLDLYPGPLLHMIISQDTISTYYLGKKDLEEKREIIFDAPSIAIVTLQLLCKLGVNLILLVGQNFAYKNNQYYSSGIKYENRPTELTEQEKDRLIEVESVNPGEKVFTVSSHSQARMEMEGYIRQISSKTEIINTTKGGAKIEGTRFIPLEEVIADRLKEPVVEENWHKSNGNPYDTLFIRSHVQAMKMENTLFNQLLEDSVNLLKKMDKAVSIPDQNQINQFFSKFDKLFKKILKNTFFKVFIKPMVRISFELLLKEIIPIRSITDPMEKANRTIDIFGKFFFECHTTNQDIKSLFDDLNNTIYGTVETSRSGG